ncbi:MAG: hypothetical protein HY365_01125 [Candidatus Aenigmarchaeota archaeon]|nr:hypothetical protein [Candidatus Aenigmarchaeota archaeon]
MALKDVLGIARMFISQSKEEFDVMDHKLLRITSGLVSFIVAGLVWMLLFRPPV